MRPTIEEVKEHFKDAEIVKTLHNREIIYDTNIRKGLHYWMDGVWVDYVSQWGVNNSGEIWNNRQGYAEIIKYKNNNMKTLNRKDFKRIYNIACVNWKITLVRMYGKEFAVQDSVQITDDDYNKMRKACTPDQNILFDEIFGKDKKDLNKWFVDDRFPKLMIYYTDKGTMHGIGFDGVWFEDVTFHFSPYEDGNNRVATKDEAEIKLTIEAKKRGFKDGNHNCMVMDTRELKGSLEYELANKEMTSLNIKGSKSGVNRIFCKGKWAEIIKEEEKTYKIGQRFKLDNYKYILAKSNGDNEVVLVNLSNGNIYDYPKKVAQQNKITKKEFNSITDGCEATLYKDVK